ICALAFLLLLGSASPAWPAPPAGATPAAPAPQAAKARVAYYQKASMTFAANQGQTDPQVRFLAQGESYSVCFPPTEIVFALPEAAGQTAKGRGAASGPRKTAVVRMKLIGGNPTPTIAGLDELPGKANYFIGNDPSKWRADVPTYAKVEYRD